VSRSKPERIEVKMGGAQCGMREHKKYIVGAQVRDKREHR
jgi:hypothetical protein